MDIEEEIFKKAKIDYKKLPKYGFKKENSIYRYSQNIMNNTFRVDIEINEAKNIKGTIFDLSADEEYTSFRVKGITGSFVNQVKEEFINILKNIRNNCFTMEYFTFAQANRITQMIKEKYGDNPEFEWEKFPGYATFRNQDSKKWYGIIMNVDKSKLGEKITGELEIINVKLEPSEINELLKQKGFYPAYHMNKKSWISIALDDTLTDEAIMNLITKSYSYTISGKSCSNEWIVPANPKYFDVEEALKKNNTIIWKQSTNIKKDDIVYLYVAKPFSAIMYKFKVIEVNIPYKSKNEYINIQKVMKIDLLTRYEKDKLSFAKLKTFGINALRGPRYMPLSLSEYINKNMK